jgi:hypothetical protein
MENEFFVYKVNKIPFYKNRIFWLRYFLPFFTVIASFGFCYSFLYVSDYFSSDAVISTHEAITSKELKTISDICQSERVAEATSSVLASAQQYHENGSYISSEEIMESTSTYFSTTTYLVTISFKSKDSSITQIVINEIASQAVSICQNEISLLANNVYVYSFSSQTQKIDSYRYQYITGFCVLGFVIPLSIFSFRDNRKVFLKI